MAMQTGEIVDDILHGFPAVQAKRMPWESTWREVDERVNPLGQGGFSQKSAGGVRGMEIFDHTASLGLDRFTSAYTGMIIPRGERYQQVSTTDPDLNEDPEMQAWLEHATDRLFAARYSPQAGFDPEANMCIRSLGSYGSAPFWVDHWEGRGLFYKTFHLSEVYVEEDFRGRIDTIYREYELTARQAAQEFGRDNLTPLIARASNHPDTKFKFLHVVRPRVDRDPQRLDFRRMRFESRYISLADKMQIREGGYTSQPMAFSRYVTAPREIYGRSPAIQVMGSIRTVNAIAKTLLRAGHKAVDPPLLVPEDGVLSQIQNMPGGINVGGMGFDGQAMVQPLHTTGQLPIGMELLNNEREPIRDAFLEKVWSLVLERKDRMTATEVLEISRMQGMLLAPMASRQETEWQGVQTERELDILVSSGFIRPPPPVFREAGGRIKMIYDNPLSRAAKAEEALGFGRYVEMLTPLAGIVGEEVYDVIDTEAAPRELAKALAVRSRYLSTPEKVAEKREARAQAKQMEAGLAGLEQAAAAVKNLSAARGEETALAA